ncbi:MAG: hypothetical protein ACXWUM_00860 [Burkholderiaceae bacterium]
MHWGLALGAAATLGAAAVIVTQWSGQQGTAAPSAPPSREAVAAGLKQALGAEGQAIASTLTSGLGMGLLQGVLGLDPVGEESIESTESVAADADGPAGERRTRTTMRVEGSGSRITLHADFEVREVRGQSRINTRARLTVSLDYCPDKDGRVVADVLYQGSGDNAMANAAVTAGYSVNVSAKGQAKASVNDQALMSRIDQELRYEHSTRGGQSPTSAASQATATRKATSGSYTIGTSTAVESAVHSADNTVQVTNRTRNFRFDAGPGDDPLANMYLATLTYLWLDTALTSIFEKAQAKWRGGACVELLVRPPVKAGGTANATQPKERKPFEVAVRHKIEQVELPLPIDATFDGRDTLEPKRVDKAPRRFDYVSGPDPRDYGNVALKSVSRRGIAQDRVAFSNDQRFEGIFSAHTGGPMQALAEGRVTWQGKPGAPDTYVPIGSVRVSGTRRKCKVEGAADLTESDGELHLKRDAAGRPIEYRGHGIKTMPLRFTCPGSTATMDMPVAWFGTAESYRPVSEDGAIDGSLKQGIVNWTWRFKQ